jgi:hypothetical protein
MKEEDLIKKLENVELPDIKFQGHQRRLRMALLDTGYLNRQQGATLIELAKSKVKGVKSTMIKGLVARQPVWKTAVVGLALVIILGLSITIPSLRTESVYAQAEEITKSSASVKEALGGGEIQVVRIDISDMAGTGTVIAKGDAGSVLTEVDLKANKVTATFVVDDQRVIEIAKADPQVKDLLDSGATIGEVSTMYISGANGNVATGESENISETLVMVDINGTEDSYVAYIDLAEGKVERLLKTMSMDSPSGPEFSSIPDKAAQ